MFEIRETKTFATCGGIYSPCSTYSDHPDWDKMVDLNRHIPKGEKALFVEFWCKKFCLCRRHGMEFLKIVSESCAAVSEEAEELGWGMD